MKTTTAIIFSTLLLPLAVGCGGSTGHSCTVTTLSISPQSAVASHTAASPGNQQQFMAGPVFPSGCPPVPLPFDFATWSVSDPVNVSISNANDLTRGTATCTGATARPITVTATANDVRLAGGVNVSGTATLTCN